MDYIMSEVVANQLVAASTFYGFDLGINGLSYLWFQFSGAIAAGNTAATPNNVLSMLQLLQVTYLGQAIWSGRPQELARMGGVITGYSPFFRTGSTRGNNEVVVEWWLPFGRRLFDPNELYPKVKRGELRLEMTGATSFTNITSPRITAQQVELPGATSKRFNKVTQRVTTPAATGNLDMPQPIGNLLRGMLVTETTQYQDITTQGGVQSAILRVNNAERYVVGGQIGHHRHMLQARTDVGADLLVTAVEENVAGAYTQNADTYSGWSNTNEWSWGYAYVDLDPTKDDLYSLDTKGLSSCDLRLNMQVAEQVRVLSYESVAHAGA